MKVFKKAIVLTIISFFIFGLVGMVFAAETGTTDKNKQVKDAITNTLTNIGKEAGYNANQSDATAFAAKVGTVINSILAVLGVVFLALVVYSGYQWMTAGGEEEKITKARDRIIQAGIGIAIIASAYAITGVIVNKLNNPVQNTPASSGQTIGGAGGCLNKADNTSCGDNMVCSDSECITKCLKEHRLTGDCRAPAACGSAIGKIYTGLCPGGNNNVCCSVGEGI